MARLASFKDNKERGFVMDIEEIKVTALMLTDYEKEQIIRFVDGTSSIERQEISAMSYDDSVLIKLGDILKK